MTAPAAALAPAVPSKKAERPAERADSGSGEASGSDQAASGQASGPTPRPAPEKAKESPSQLEAKALRGKLGHLVTALAPGVDALPRMGAALFVALLAADQGIAKASAMTGSEVKEYAEAFARQHPTVWGAAMGCNVMHLVTVLEIGRMIEAPDEEAKAAVRAEFSSVMSKLAPL